MPVKVNIELDIVSAAIVEHVAKNRASDFLLSFLADEVQQTSFCPRGETHPAGPANGKRQ